jgi:hypothetical protein
MLLQTMDEPWESSIKEYGVVNVTGFRIVDPTKRYVREFLRKWTALDASNFPGAGKNSISVSSYFFFITFLRSTAQHGRQVVCPTKFLASQPA